MGTMFEELVRRFNEENNEEAGEHWTPRDAVRLMANLMFLPVAEKIESGTYLLYDCACGTDAAIAAFAEEVRVGNPACPDALRTLNDHFANETAPGPVKASNFVLGQAQPGESADNRFFRTALRQDMVAAAALLLNAAKPMA